MSWVTKRIVIPNSSRTCEHEVLEVAAGLRVDRGERLVHQQDRRLVGERAGDRDPLLHPAGELPRVAVHEPDEPDGAERLLDQGGALPLRELLVAQRQQDVDRTDIHGISERLYSWKTIAIRSGGPVTRLPRSSTSPADGRSSPAMHLSSVVLPQPDGPTTQTNSPSSIENVTSPDRVRRGRAAAVGLAEPLDLEHRHRYCGVAARQPRCQASTCRSTRRKRAFRR